MVWVQSPKYSGGKFESSGLNYSGGKFESSGLNYSGGKVECF